jgi:hypothetical protein
VAKYTSNHPDVIEALTALVGNVDSVRRVVIDIQSGHVPVVHIERYGDEKMLDVVRSLAGVEIEREEQ